ncbi:hypothetical protein V6N13_047458 [Hibiscus sabdariffa]
MHREGMVTSDEGISKGSDTCTLCQGMNYYRALKQLSFLDSSSETGITETEEEGIALMKYWEHKAEQDPHLVYLRSHLP